MSPPLSQGNPGSANSISELSTGSATLLLSSLAGPAAIVTPSGVIRLTNKAFLREFKFDDSNALTGQQLESCLQLPPLGGYLEETLASDRFVRLILPEGKFPGKMISACRVRGHVDSGELILFVIEKRSSAEESRDYRRLWKRERQARRKLAHLTRQLQRAQRQLKLLNGTLIGVVRSEMEGLGEMLGEAGGGGSDGSAVLSSVSHELRSPISSIQWMSEIMLDYRDLAPAKYEEFLAIIHAESRRLSRLVEDILDLSRIDSEGVEPRFQRLNLHDTVQTAANSIAPLAERKGLSLTVEIAEELPVIDSDPDRVSQVIHNLVSNAIKFTEKGGAILVTAEAADGGIEVSVRDDGIGISEAEAGRVFEKFYQSDGGIAAGVKGTGIGLYLCKQIIEALGGSIWVTSEPGVGSTFSFKLPADRAAISS